ncbi:hypothetical protein [Luteimonas kalidii]|uniref:Uncharacterized protein n=1 Tax=Luteimonas kalidii TaxID=3042025 RepID=A0ABT6JX98_9GAMM|nr:hypothetical protein [Luteimonas kalidii]MDH5835328.1 hypothetical protein [Luteimonas kalidii]
MTASTPVERIGEVLETADYRRLPSPLLIAGLAFEFPAAFIGPDRSSDLVLVADTAFETATRILRKVESLGRALDVLQSKRPITIVLAGPRPESEVIEAMAKIGRVLPVGTQVDDDPSVGLTNWLAVLLPLALPQPSQGVADPIASIRAATSDIDSQVRGLIDVAQQGADAVQTGLHDLLTDVLDESEEAP